MRGTVAWLNGRWGTPTGLAIPLSDRGLQLADGVFETVLIHAGRPQLLDAHHSRWCEGAALLGMAEPPSIRSLDPLIKDACRRAELSNGSGALRLNWSRDGAEARGIQVPKGDPDPSQHRFWLTLSPHTPSFSAVHAWISRHERRNATSRLSRCKTFAYGQAIQARREARENSAEEALLLSTTGELCCASTANLLVQRRGEWLTPPLSSGCLPGIMRQQMLNLRLAREEHLGPYPERSDQWLLINSLDCRMVRSVNGQVLNAGVDAAALWRRLLAKGTPPDQG